MSTAAPLRLLVAGLLLIAGPLLAGPFDGFVAEARRRHGDEGAEAAGFLVENMPEKDRASLAEPFLVENLDLAFRARKEFPWAAAVPADLFRNDVLPYAVFDEPRDPWRRELLDIARPIVAGSTNASEAAHRLNREVFNRVQVHYNTGRKRPNQSLVESRASGKATCTGLSIILVEACRAVGIPARAVGTPMWTNERGNHTWVEVWDGGWRFAGADEPDPAGLDHGWFVADAAEARADDLRHAIYATSWERSDLRFPMVWTRGESTVPAVNVTARYAKAGAGAAAEMARLGVRLWDREGGERMAAKVCVLDGVRRACALADTKAGKADLNDMPRFALKPGSRGWLRFTVGTEVREVAFGPLEKGDPTVDARWDRLVPASAKVEAVRDWLDLPAAERKESADPAAAPLSRSEAERVVSMIESGLRLRLAAERKAEVESRSIGQDGKTLRWLERTFGEAPATGRSLWISMHGGGGAPPRVNDQQWSNQITLYQPSEGIYVAPRAPTDTWNLWHEAHIDTLFQRLIDDFVAVRGVDPDRVYLMGYSAGGDGVWQLAPRMADRFAAASMMAGHPNEASLLGLRNLPFAIFMGGEDSAYNRNRIAAERGAELDRLAAADPGGYVHRVRIFEGLGHWMKLKDAEGVPWMSEFRRNPWPRKVVWQQDDVVHRRFYWLRVPEASQIEERALMTATVEGQDVRLEGKVPAGLQLRLSDALLDLDKPVRVLVGGREVFQGEVPRRASVIRESLRERLDAASAATALLALP